MPAETQPTIVVTPPPDAAANNEAVARKLEAQDASGHSTAGGPEDFVSVHAALDKLAAEVKPPEAPVVEPPAAPAAPTVTPPDEAQSAAKAAEAKAATEAEAAKATGADPFKDVPQLPQGTSTKARESFEAIKTRAAQEVSSRDQQIEALTTKLKELEQRASTPTTEQLEKDKQLDTMRTQLAKLDLNFDPKFKDFDSKLSATHEFVYAQLRRSPQVNEDVISEIKKFGGPEQCNLSKLFESLKDPTLQRIVESKIADAAMLRHEKEQALKTTEANMTEYLKAREDAYKNSVTSHTTATQKQLTELLGALDWMKPKADDVAGKEFAEHVRGEVASALQDDSPQMRAILLTGYAQMCHLQNVTKAQAAELATAKKELSDVQAKYAKVKGASTSRLRDSNAPAGGNPAAAPKPSSQFTERADDALDRIAKQITEQRAQTPARA